MSNGQLSVLNEHNNTPPLPRSQLDQYLNIELRYNDRRQGPEKCKKAQFSPTATIRDVIKEFLKLINMEFMCPENITLTDITHDKHYDVPLDNLNMTLNQLNITDGCTLSFEPLLTSMAEDPYTLSIWSPNDIEKVEYRWFKNSNTLGMLLEYIIQTFLLESIERERIHLFHKTDELDILSNYDNSLNQLGIGRYDHIDVKIIPPEPYSPLSKITNTSNGFLSSFNGQDNFSRLSDTESSSKMTLELEYMDSFQNIKKRVVDRFLLTTTVHELIKSLIELANLKDLRPEDVSLVAFSDGTQRHPISIVFGYQTLKYLKIKNQDTLYFEPSIAFVSALICYLTVKRVGDSKSLDYIWNKKTITLGMLLEYIIQEFSLQTIERKRIHLFKSFDKTLDHTLHSDTLLSDLGVTNHDWIYCKIIESYSSSIFDEYYNVRIECSYGSNGNRSFNVPYIITIEELKNEIENQFKDYIVTDWKLFNRMHCRIDEANITKTLFDLGIESGHTVYATLQLVVSGNSLSKLNTGSNTPIRFSSLIAKSQPDEVTVTCHVSTFETINTKASVNDTVGELVKKIEVLNKHRPLTQFEVWCGSINIDTNQPNRHLSDFGIRAGDTLDVKLVEKASPRYTLEQPRLTSSLKLDILPEGNIFSSSPVGLSNIGNTCYMNSALQCLAHAKPLTQFFLNILSQDVSGTEDNLSDASYNYFYTIGTVIGAYADVLRNLWSPKKTSYFSSSFRPNHIKDIIGQKAPRFATYDQQDAQEFITYLLDEIHKELKEKNGNESTTIIEELFFGKIESTITCSECHHQVKTINPISFLPLPLAQQGRTFIVKFVAKNGDQVSTVVSVPENGQVKSILQAFIDSEPSYRFWNSIIIMTNDEQLDLEMPIDQLSCTEIIIVEQEDFLGSQGFDQIYGKHTKTLSLESCLKDFCSIENLEDSWLCQQESCKKQTKATKQLQLCSLPPILIIQFKRFSHENGLRHKIETFVDFPIDGLDLSTFLSTTSSSSEAIYDLFAVSNHIGSIYGGHYIAYARHEVNGKNEWYKFDDSYVSSYFSKSSVVSKDAYLLFYIRRDKLQQSTAATTS